MCSDQTHKYLNTDELNQIQLIFAMIDIKY